ncbi:hypothetical protein ACLKA6_012247 [Drosophila palustris]
MFRNQYDGDLALWSPQGRLFQVEYAMEAVNLGTAAVGLKTEELAVLVALSKPSTELSVSLPKIFPIDVHMGISIAGIMSDAQVISKYLRTECLTFRHTYNSAYPVTRLVNNLGNKMQVNTQGHRSRPFGTGLLLAGYDEKGCHIYQIMPSANVFNCKAMAIGARSQGARTYLGRYQVLFPSSSKDEIICHGIHAINAAHPIDEKLNITIGIVGKNQPFKLLSAEECSAYQDMCNIGDVPHDPTPNETELDEASNNES